MNDEVSTLSEAARKLLQAITPGKPRNPKTLRDQTKLTQTEFAAATQELIERRRVALEGKRLRLVDVTASEPADRHSGDSPKRLRAMERLSDPARAIFDQLPPDGARVSNASLRSRPELKGIGDDVYPKAKDELIRSGLVRAGSGRTGTLARIVEEPPESVEAPEVEQPSLPGGVVSEDELYEPFSSWLASTLGGFAFSRATVTSSGRNRPRASGKWSRPDVTAVTVSNFELLPGATVEVSSYEIKRSVDADKIESVYEAAAHGRWAHRTSLVVETLTNGPALADEIIDEAARFGLGLYTMTRSERATWEITEVREPESREPDPQNLSDLVEYFLGLFGKGVRAEYVMSIR